ncbi:MAG: Lrp/AsnC family transcriptional regulator [Firmicutes bacterium]|nr:Lrp/AsnC family transcriptional regulator [Bacillota bacterium]
MDDRDKAGRMPPALPFSFTQEGLDAVDLAIIRILQADGRMPFVEVAERVGVSERTVRRKFYRMVENRTLQVVAVANPLTMGYHCPAIIGIQCDLPKIGELMAALCGLPQLRFVALATGPYEIIVEGYFPTHSDLYNFRSQVLHKIDGVNHSTVAIVLQVEKQIYHWALPGTEPESQERTGPLHLAGPEYRPRLTALDLDIIRWLQRDGRMPNSDLAARVGVSPVTVAKRVHQLRNDAVIRVVAVVNPFHAGFRTPAIIGLNIEPHRQPKVMEHLCLHPRLTYAAVTTGEFDAVVMGYFADNQDLARFVVTELASIHGLRRVNTSILFAIPKQAYDWGAVPMVSLESTE